MISKREDQLAAAERLSERQPHGLFYGADGVTGGHRMFICDSNDKGMLGKLREAIMEVSLNTGLPSKVVVFTSPPWGVLNHSESGLGNTYRATDDEGHDIPLLEGEITKLFSMYSGVMADLNQGWERDGGTVTLVLWSMLV